MVPRDRGKASEKATASQSRSPASNGSYHALIQDKVKDQSQDVLTQPMSATTSASASSTAKLLNDVKELANTNRTLVGKVADQSRSRNKPRNMSYGLEQAQLEVVRERAGHSHLDKEPDEVQRLKQQLQKEKEENWELKYKLRDQKVEIETLGTRLRNCVVINDEESLSSLEKTAQEIYLEEKVEELQKKLEMQRNSRGDGMATSRAL
jgi:hypothetical protein